MVLDAAPAAAAPNMPDYERARGEFSWDSARRALDGLPGGRGLNIAHEAVDRHARGGRAGHVALRCLAVSGARQEIVSPSWIATTRQAAAGAGSRSLSITSGSRMAATASPMMNRVRGGMRTGVARRRGIWPMPGIRPARPGGGKP